MKAFRSFVSKNKLAFFVAFLILVLDQVTKSIIKNCFEPGDRLEVISGFFNLVYVLNKGIVFGILNREGVHFYILILMIFFSICFLTYLLNTHIAYNKKAKVAIGLILGGAVGNLWDKIVLGGVVDFLDFYVGSFHWPAFNVADSSITCGVFLLLLTNLKKRN